jgi:alkanesulfonate monooxygenase SsuD/methylene tetrahydromethanopterin reductase-like flavin-dependent oxidoreductase (luciferase family)
MRAYADDIRARADRHGRDPSQLKLIFGMQTVVDRSRDRAVEKYEEFRSLIRIESALAIVSGHTGVDFSTLGLDDNVADVDRRASAASSTPSCRRTTASRSPYGRQLSCTAWQWALPPQ